MSQGTFSDTMIHLEVFKRIFVGGPKIDFFPKGLVQGFWSKMTKLLTPFFSLVYVPRDLGVS